MTGLVAPALMLLSLAATNPADDFEWGRTAFLRGEYARAIGLLHPLIYPELRLDSEEEVLQTHRMLGVAYLFENQPAEAKREFRKLLELAPDFQFDPFLDPPRVVEFFQGVVREQREELGDIEARLRKREAELSRRTSGIIERRLEKRSYGMNFLPFGAGQFQNGERRKGWMFLAGESAFALTSVAAFAINFAAYGVRPLRPCLDPVTPQPNGDPGICRPDRIDRRGENLSEALTGVQVASGGLFFAAAIWGIVDAVRHFKPEVPLGDTFIPAPPPAPAHGELQRSVPAGVAGAADADTFSGGYAAGDVGIGEMSDVVHTSPPRTSSRERAAVSLLPSLSSTSPGVMLSFSF